MYGKDSISFWGQNKNNLKKSQTHFNMMFQISLHFE
jgi:hypothetical protein